MINENITKTSCAYSCIVTKLQFVSNLRMTKSFELHNIFNMDKTPVWFDMAGNFTVNPKGEKKKFTFMEWVMKKVSSQLY